MAAEFVASRGLDHVELVLADACDTGIETGSFDLVHARTLLINVPEPPEALTEMVRLARPGGWAVGIEPDVESALCYPPLPAFDRLCELFEAAFARNGAGPHFGRRMADLYRRAGLEDVTVEASAVLYPPGHSRRTIRADLVQSLRPQILEMGLANEGELNELDAAARTHFDDPDTVVTPLPSRSSAGAENPPQPERTRAGRPEHASETSSYVGGTGIAPPESCSGSPSYLGPLSWAPSPGFQAANGRGRPCAGPRPRGGRRPCLRGRGGRWRGRSRGRRSKATRSRSARPRARPRRPRGPV